MKYLAFVIGFLLMVTSFVAQGRTYGVKAFKGQFYADLLKRSCKPSEWNDIEPFLKKSNFAAQQFPEYDFEFANGSITSEKEKLKLEVLDRPKMTIDGHVFEGTMCEIVAQISREASVAKFDWRRLLVPRAEARDVLKTEVTNWDRARWVGVGVAGAAGSIALGMTGFGLIVAGAPAALAAGYIGGEMLRADLDFNRKRLEDAYAKTRSRLVVVSCSQREVVFRAPGGTEVTLTRDRDPSLYIKTREFEGRLRGSFSSTASGAGARWANKCFNREDVARLSPASPTAPPRVTITRMAPPPSLAPAPPPPVPAATSAATAAVDHDLDSIDNMFDTVPAAPAARSSNN